MSRMPNCCLKFSSGSFSRSFSEVCSCSFWWCPFPPVLECFLKTFSEFFSLSLKQDERYLDWVCGVSCPWPRFCPSVLRSTDLKPQLGSRQRGKPPCRPLLFCLASTQGVLALLMWLLRPCLTPCALEQWHVCNSGFLDMLSPGLFVLWSFLKSFTWGDLLHILQNGLRGSLFYQHLSTPAHFWGLKFLPRCSNTGEGGTKW